MDVLVSKASKRIAWWTLAIMVSLGAAPRAHAQDTTTTTTETQTVTETTETPGSTETTTEVTTTETTTVAEPTPVTTEAAPVSTEPVPVVEAPPVEQAVEEGSWTDNLSFRVFADGYVAAHWTLPNGFEGIHTGPGEIGNRAYDVYGGLSLAFAGLDLRYAPDPIGAAIDIRFGTAVPRLLGPTSGLPDGMQFLKQAYVSWRPLDTVQIDFGQFDTIFGAEVSESWLNPNYSRGSLYNVIQPFYHTGFRASWAVIPELTLTGIAVNGWNNVSDNNDGKSGGLQASLALGDFSMALGYMTGPEQSGNDDNFRHLVDVIFRLNVGDLALVANADLTHETFQAEDGSDFTVTQMGAMLGAQYRFIPEFALALRGEVLYFPDAGDNTLSTGTFTIEYAPDPHLVIRLDNRLDVSSTDSFIDNDSQPTETAFSTILGMVVHSD